MAARNLSHYLKSIQVGPINEPSEVKQIDDLLRDAWDEFSGHDSEGMEAYKLQDRMESISWNPPLLSFTIERHGQTAQGSSMASLHVWEIDIENLAALCHVGGFRRVGEIDNRMDVNAIAKEIADKMESGDYDSRIVEKGNGEVQLDIANIIPDRGVKQTTASRRKRFRKKLEEQIPGFKKIRANRYKRN